MFQGDRPLAPFLCDELACIFKELMNRFIKLDVMKAADTLQKLSKMKADDKQNHVSYKDVDVGFAANAVLMSAPKSVSELQKMAFRTGCCQFLAATTTMLLEKNSRLHVWRHWHSTTSVRLRSFDRSSGCACMMSGSVNRSSGCAWIMSGNCCCWQ